MKRMLTGNRLQGTVGQPRGAWRYSLFPIPSSVLLALCLCIPAAIPTGASDAEVVRLPQDLVIPLNELGWEALWVLDQKQDLVSCKPIPKQPHEFDCGSARYRIKLRPAAGPLEDPGPGTQKEKGPHAAAPPQKLEVNR